MVSITATGKEILRNAPPLMQEAFVEKFSCLQEWEQTMILSALQRLVAIMDAKSIQATSSIDCQIVKSGETTSTSF
jgi:hypothetical protein